jgi:hypothetical protein
MASREINFWCVGQGSCPVMCDADATISCFVQRATLLENAGRSLLEAFKVVHCSDDSSVHGSLR